MTSRVNKMPTLNQMNEIKLGQRWKHSKSEVLFEIEKERLSGRMREVLLNPILVPSGSRAYRCWKWVGSIQSSMEKFNDKSKKKDRENKKER